MSTILSLGDSGVSTLQLILAKQGFDCGEDVVTRIFGLSTQSEVKLFQACHIDSNGKSLVVDGIVGPDTWWALYHPTDSIQHQLVEDMPIQQASNPIAQAALDSAWAELRKGIKECPDGSNRGSEIDLYTGMSGKPVSMVGPRWCAYFVSWNFAKSPGGSPFGRIGGAQSIVFWCQKHIPDSVIMRDANTPFFPKPGDIAIIAENQTHGHVVHVAAAWKGFCWTVEGNCGNAVRTRKLPVLSFRYIVNFDNVARVRGLM